MTYTVGLRAWPQTAVLITTGRKACQGFAYIALLASLAVITLTLGMAAENIAQTAKREREAQLLFVGKQFRNAIADYYEKSPQSAKQYPKALADLLTDNRFPRPARHLRKIYVDPMRGSADWGIVRNNQGDILGVYSLSQEMPIKTRFDQDIQESFGDGLLRSYADWKFVYRPAAGATGDSIGNEIDFNKDRKNNGSGNLEFQTPPENLVGTLQN